MVRVLVWSLLVRAWTFHGRADAIWSRQRSEHGKTGGVGGEAQRCRARVVDAVGRADPDPHPFDPERHRYPVSGSGNTASSSKRV